mgnify:CR=1 FL=1
MIRRKRYIIEMANDFERKFPENAERIMKIRNMYISCMLNEIDVINALMETIGGISVEEWAKVNDLIG